MQEWWVSLRRNDGSAWVGIYTILAKRICGTFGLALNHKVSTSAKLEEPLFVNSHIHYLSRLMRYNYLKSLFLTTSIIIWI